MKWLLEAKTFVGLAGTVSTVAAIEVGLAEYDRDAIHHLGLTRGAVEDVFRTLATETHDERRRNPGLPLDHVPTVVGGCCVVVALLRGLHLDAVTVTVQRAGREIGEDA